MHRLATLALLLLPACLSPDGGTPFVASFTVADAGYAKTDGNALVVSGTVAMRAELYAKGTDAPLVLPIVVDEGTVVAINRDLSEKVVLEPGEPLPWWAALLFRIGEAAELGVTFSDPPEPES